MERNEGPPVDNRAHFGLRLWLKIESALPLFVVDLSGSFSMFGMAVMAFIVLAVCNSLFEDQFPKWSRHWFLLGFAIALNCGFAFLLSRNGLLKGLFSNVGLTRVFLILFAISVLGRLIAILLDYFLPTRSGDWFCGIRLGMKRDK